MNTNRQAGRFHLIDHCERALGFSYRNVVDGSICVGMLRFRFTICGVEFLDKISEGKY